MSPKISLIDKLNAAGEQPVIDLFGMSDEVLSIYNSGDQVAMRSLTEAYTDYLKRRNSIIGVNIEQRALSNLNVASFYADYVAKGLSVFDAEAAKKKTLSHLLDIGPVSTFFHTVTGYTPPVQLPAKLHIAFDNEVYYLDRFHKEGFVRSQDTDRIVVMLRRYTPIKPSDVVDYLSTLSIRMQRKKALNAAEAAVQNLPANLQEALRNKDIQLEVELRNNLKEYEEYSDFKHRLEVTCAIVPLGVVKEAWKEGKIEHSQWYYNLLDLQQPDTKLWWRIVLPYDGSFPKKEKVHRAIELNFKQNKDEVSRIVDVIRSYFFPLENFYRLKDVSSQQLNKVALETVQKLQQKEDHKKTQKATLEEITALHNKNASKKSN